MTTMKKEYKTLSFRLIQLRSRENVMLTTSVDNNAEVVTADSNQRNTSSMIWGEEE